MTKKKSKKESESKGEKKKKESQEPEKEEREVKNQRDLLKKLKKGDLRRILRVLNKQGLELVKKDSERKFNSQKELNEFVVEGISDFLNKKLDSFSERASDLEEKGVDTGVVSMKLMSAPLKIKNFEATQEKKDFDKIIEVFEKLGEELEKEEDSLKTNTKKKKKKSKNKNQEEEIEEALESFKKIKKDLKKIKGKDK